LRVVHQPPVLARQGSADGGVEQSLFDLRMDAQHLADAAGEGIDLLGCAAGAMSSESSSREAGRARAIGMSSVMCRRRASCSKHPPAAVVPSTVRYHSTMTATPRLSK